MSSWAAGVQPNDVAPTSRPSGSLLDVRTIRKSFGNTHALTDVSLQVEPGEVVGLIGENGAGKSTLLHIISGNTRQDSGSVLVRGEPVSFTSAREANFAGVFHIYQELALLANLPVFENFFLSHEERFSRLGVINRREMRERTRACLSLFGHEWIEPSRLVGAYDFSTRQVIEIVKAFALTELLEIDFPVLLLDEPTASLTREEVEFFEALVQRARERAGIIFVSHRLSEVLAMSDRVYVLKDGVVTAEVSPSEVGPSEVSERELHRLMVGRERVEFFYQQDLQLEPRPQVALDVRGLSRAGSFRDVNLSVRAGEIVGVSGLLNSGKSELARALFGALAADGEIRLGDVQVEHPSISKMAKAGVGYVPPDRHSEGIILVLPVSWNITLAELAQGAGRGAFLDVRSEDEQARDYIDRLSIKTAGGRALARTLSGGNQQKVLLARWLARDVMKVLILDNPTHGVDAGAKGDIYKVLRSIAKEGVGILLVSDDLLEVIGLSNRVIVMKDGEIVKELVTPPDKKPSEEELVAQML